MERKSIIGKAEKKERKAEAEARSPLYCTGTHTQAEKKHACMLAQCLGVVVCLTWIKREAARQQQQSRHAH